MKLCATLLLALALGSAAVMLSPAQEASAPAPCSSPRANDFDFWVGTWEVTANGKVAGNNTITAILGGCGCT